MVRRPSRHVRHERRSTRCCCRASSRTLGACSPIERVVDLTRGALDAARESGTAFEIVDALSILRLTYMAAGDLARSDAAAHEYEEMVQAIRIPRYMAGVEQRRAIARRCLPAVSSRRRRTRTRRTCCNRSTSTSKGSRRRCSRSATSKVASTRSGPRSREWAIQYDRPAWKFGYATLLALQGEHDSARAVVTPMLEAGIAAVVPHDDLYFLCIAAAATTLVEIGDPTYAGALFDVLAPHTSRVIVAGSGALCWGSIHRFLGPLAALLGNTDRAIVHFEAAMAVHERLGARPFLARDRLAYADLLRGAGGDSVRIETLQRTGLALARELGMRQVVARY